MTIRKLLVPALVATVLGLLSACSDDPAAPAPAGRGTIVIDVAAQHVGWECTRQEGATVAGAGDTTLVGMRVGDYTVVWGEVYGWITPEPEHRTLAADSTITFSAVYRPERPPVDNPAWLYDVLGTAADDVYAVGPRGTLLHFDGASWSRISLGVDDPVNVLGLDGGGGLWACGAAGGLWQRSGGSWDRVNLETMENLVALGTYRGVLHVGGGEGFLKRYQGGQWLDTGREIVIRDPMHLEPVDTLDRTEDLAFVTTIAHFGIGGAYRLPDYEGDPVGIQGSQGMVLGEDEDFPWRLDTLGLTVMDDPNWVMCSTSDGAHPERNFLGLNNGGLLQLQDEQGTLQWRYLPVSLGEGLRDLWLEEDGDLYSVNSDGRIVYLPAGGSPEVLYDGSAWLSGIWGTGPDNLWVVGLTEGVILHVDHDAGAGTVQVTEWDAPPLPGP